MKKLIFKLIFTTALICTTACTTWAAKTKYVTIGTGGVTGVYYPTGGAIAKFVNRKRKELKMRASVESTAGSVYNVNALISGDLEFGIVQSDRQFQAINGLADWKKKGKQTQLRSVFSLHRELVTLVAAKDAKIKSLKDLEGKRVSIGSPGSGIRGNAMDVFETAGVSIDKMRIESLKPAEAPKMIQDGRIDAFFYTVGHPSGAITEATSGKRKVEFISITGMDALIKRSPFYTTGVIPVKGYPMSASKKDVPSVGVAATLMTTADVSEDAVYNVTKEVFENLKEFKALHPAFANLEKSKMLKGLSAPMHKGAIKYFKEAGLLK